MDDPDDGTATLEVLRWFARGRCLARDVASDETSLVSGALPGERVVARTSPARGERWQVTRVLRASPERVAPACPHADRCTGCSTLHVSPGEEARYKAQTVAEVLHRFGGVTTSADDIDTIVAPSMHVRGAHRGRTRMTLGRRDGALVVGLRDRAGELVHIPDCPALRPSVRDAIAAWVDADDGAVDVAGAAIEVIEGVEGVAFIADGPGAAALARRMDVSTNLVAIGTRQGGELELLRGRWPRQRPVAGVDLDIGVDAWTQPSPDRASALYRWVDGLGDWDGARVLDATCGTGGLSLYLARRAESVVGVDAGWAAVQSAQASADALGVRNVTFRGGLIGTVAPRMVRDGLRFDHVVVNPMRRSLGDDAMRALAALRPRRIVYLAPAPRAGAEDIRALLAEGYVVDRVGACDLHPGTGHVMACVVLVAAARSAPAG